MIPSKLIKCRIDPIRHTNSIRNALVSTHRSFFIELLLRNEYYILF